MSKIEQECASKGLSKAHTYPIPACHQEAGKKHINELLEDTFNERSNSPYISSIIVVTLKKSGDIRLCLDIIND